MLSSKIFFTFFKSSSYTKKFQNTKTKLPPLVLFHSVPGLIVFVYLQQQNCTTSD